MFAIDTHTRPSLKILNSLYEHDDFMESIRTVADLGCGSGNDLQWWATRTTRDESATPLNIRCWGIDVFEQLDIAHKFANVTYQRTDFEQGVNPPKDLFDVLWCHDAFQYCLNPIGTLSKWRTIASAGGMLVIAVPQTVQVSQRKINCHLPAGVFYHHSMVSLMYQLCVTGWDCRGGFFHQVPNDPWIRAVVYNTDKPVLDPKKGNWYSLAESGLLPPTAEKSVMAHGYLRQQDLVVPWLDHNLYCLDKV